MFKYDDRLVQCFYSEESQDLYYCWFSDCHVEIECELSLESFRNTRFPKFFCVCHQEPLTSLSRATYSYYVQMFYLKINFVIPGLSFWVTIYGQIIWVTTPTICCALMMSFLLESLPHFSAKVQALTYSKLFEIPNGLPIYITLVRFTKPTQVLATFFTYISYMSFHHTRIPCLATHFIHAIMLGQPIDISKVIFGHLL